MQAIVLCEPEHLEFMDIPKPALTNDNLVLVAVEACGICGSDLRYYKGENPWALHTLGVHKDNPPNMVMGHEFAGTVVKVNSKAYEHLLGKRVGVQSFRACGTCRFCTSGRENLCPNMFHVGHAQGWGEMDFYPGAYAEYTLGWGDLCYPLEEHVSSAEAAMADIICTAVHIFNKTRFYPGATMLCIGGGPIGLATAQVALINGIQQVFISDPSDVCRAVASQYIDIQVIDPRNFDVTAFVLDHNGGKKCAAIVDSVGSNETFTLGVGLLEESGTYVNVALHETDIQFSAMCLASERSVSTSSNSTNNDVREAYDLLNASRINVKPWITHRFGLADYQKAFDLLLAPIKQAFKVVFEPGIID
jgi:threonine dehydrogenase-like Zn-dependent dehydrogenase